MLRGHFSGFYHVNTEDFVVAESQGRIIDRSKEYLNAGDRAVMRARKQLLDTVKEFVEVMPLTLANHDSIPYADARAATYILGQNDNWREAS